MWTFLAGRLNVVLAWGCLLFIVESPQLHQWADGDIEGAVADAPRCAGADEHIPQHGRADDWGGGGIAVECTQLAVGVMGVDAVVEEA